jgi:hypothetical protein
VVILAEWAVDSVIFLVPLDFIFLTHLGSGGDDGLGVTVAENVS